MNRAMLNQMPEHSKVVKGDNFCIVLFAIMTLLPLSGIGNIVRLVTAIAIFVYQSFYKGNTLARPVIQIFLLMGFGVILPFVSVYLVEGFLNIDVWLHEVERLIFNIIVIYCMSKMTISFRFVRFVSIAILIFNLAIQVLELKGNEAVFNWIQTYYMQPDDSLVHLALAQTTEIFLFRSGSIFINPNVYMVIPMITLAVVLQGQHQKSTAWNYLWIALSLYSLFLTGSRTGFIIAGLLFLYYIMKDKKTGMRKNIRILLVVVVLIFLVYLLFKEQSEISSFYQISQYRFLRIDEGMSDSFGVKWQGLFGYLKMANPLYFLTGSLGSSLAIQVDAEWGYLFQYFGICGIAWYIMFIKMIKNNKHDFQMLPQFGLIILCFVALTATIVLCMPIFPFFAMTMLPKLED